METVLATVIVTLPGPTPSASVVLSTTLVPAYTPPPSPSPSHSSSPSGGITLCDCIFPILPLATDAQLWTLGWIIFWGLILALSKCYPQLRYDWWEKWSKNPLVITLQMGFFVSLCSTIDSRYLSGRRPDSSRCQLPLSPEVRTSLRILSYMGFYATLLVVDAYMDKLPRDFKAWLKRLWREDWEKETEGQKTEMAQLKARVRLLEVKEAYWTSREIEKERAVENDRKEIARLSESVEILESQEEVRRDWEVREGEIMRHIGKMVDSLDAKEREREKKAFEERMKKSREFRIRMAESRERSGFRDFVKMRLERGVNVEEAVQDEDGEHQVAVASAA